MIPPLMVAYKREHFALSLGQFFGHTAQMTGVQMNVLCKAKIFLVGYPKCR